MKINRNALVIGLSIFVIVLLVLNIIVIHEASFNNKKDKRTHQKENEVIKPF